MKCSKCGAELSEDTKFCSFCGAKIKESNMQNNSATTPDVNTEDDTVTKPDANIDSNTTNSTYAYGNAPKMSQAKESIADKIKSKRKAFWNKQSLFRKVATVTIVLFTLLCLIAFVAGKTDAGIIALVQIALVVVAILMKKQIIKAPKSWLYIVSIVLAIVLLIPYFSIFNAKKIDGEKFAWSEIVLGDVIPETKSHLGKIYSNSNDTLMMYVYKTSENQYDNYVDDCQNQGFTVEIEQVGNTFNVYNENGYVVSLDYDAELSRMEINVNAPIDLGTLEWPESGLAQLITAPNSTTGYIDKDDETGFTAYIGDMTLTDFEKYIKSCTDMGFLIDASKTEKKYIAKNSDGYTLNVNYEGNNTICISVAEPEYKVDIKVECIENWIFSKYDVEVYLDDSQEGTLTHGATETYPETLTKGTYVLKFVSAEDDTVTGEVKIDISKDESLEYKISCSSSEINIDTIVGTADEEETETSEETAAPTESEETTELEIQGNLTVDNCEDLAAILSMKAESDPSYVSFASKYEGKTIEFDGSIDYLTNHENYKTRYDMLVSAGDYDADHQIGPTFKFDEIATYEIDYGNQDYVKAGQNVHIIAEVESFNTNSQLFFLNPVSVSVR